jgi:hypothetical protein
MLAVLWISCRYRHEVHYVDVPIMSVGMLRTGVCRGRVLALSA